MCLYVEGNVAKGKLCWLRLKEIMKVTGNEFDARKHN